LVSLLPRQRRALIHDGVGGSRRGGTLPGGSTTTASLAGGRVLLSGLISIEDFDYVVFYEKLFLASCFGCHHGVAPSAPCTRLHRVDAALVTDKLWIAAHPQKLGLKPLEDPVWHQCRTPRPRSSARRSSTRDHHRRWRREWSTGTVGAGHES
jgi:hypothetical protein